MNILKFFYFNLFLAAFVSNDLAAQSSIDSFITTLHNSNAKSMIAMVAPQKAADSGRIYGHTTERVLTSMNILLIKKHFPKYLLISNLVQSLNDPERDWYADLLLYSLARLPSINILSCNNRQDWLELKPNMNITYKESDIQMWSKYLAGLSLSDSW